jgi:hypothetical protein
VDGLCCYYDLYSYGHVEGAYAIYMSDIDGECLVCWAVGVH